MNPKHQRLALFRSLKKSTNALLIALGLASLSVGCFRSPPLTSEDVEWFQAMPSIGHTRNEAALAKVFDGSTVNTSALDGTGYESQGDFLYALSEQYYYWDEFDVAIRLLEQSGFPDREFDLGRVSALVYLAAGRYDLFENLMGELEQAGAVSPGTRTALKEWTPADLAFLVTISPPKENFFDWAVNRRMLFQLTMLGIQVSQNAFPEEVDKLAIEWIQRMLLDEFVVRSVIEEGKKMSPLVDAWLDATRFLERAVLSKGLDVDAIHGARFEIGQALLSEELQSQRARRLVESKGDVFRDRFKQADSAAVPAQSRRLKQPK